VSIGGSKRSGLSVSATVDEEGRSQCRPLGTLPMHSKYTRASKVTIESVAGQLGISGGAIAGGMAKENYAYVLKPAMNIPSDWWASNTLLTSNCGVCNCGRRSSGNLLAADATLKERRYFGAWPLPLRNVWPPLLKAMSFVNLLRREMQPNRRFLADASRAAKPGR
jgi:hypothetical protein